MFKTDFDNITILDRGVKNTLRRRIKESIFIHKELQPKLNKDCGRDFPKIYSYLLATKTTAGASAAKQGEKTCRMRADILRMNVSKVIFIFLVCSVGSLKHFCLKMQLIANDQWRSHWGGKGAECHPWPRKFAKNREKRGKESGKIGEKSGKIGKKEEKSGRKGLNREISLTFAPPYR